jgi:hypothetical protein
VRGKARRLYVS